MSLFQLQLWWDTSYFGLKNSVSLPVIIDFFFYYLFIVFSMAQADGVTRHVTMEEKTRKLYCILSPRNTSRPDLLSSIQVCQMKKLRKYFPPNSDTCHRWRLWRVKSASTDFLWHCSAGETQSQHCILGVSRMQVSQWNFLPDFTATSEDT